MNEIILYSNNCPKCRVLKNKLNEAKIEFKEMNDIEIMQNLGFTYMPRLDVYGQVMNFSEAVNWVKTEGKH